MAVPARTRTGTRSPDARSLPGQTRYGSARAPAGGAGTRRGPRIWADGAAVAAGTVLIGWHGSRLGQWIVDDAAITFAYARSIDEGLGPVQQPGAPRVEGYSNPTWLALLVVGRRLGLFDHRAVFGVPDLVLYPKLLGLLCAAGILIAVSCVARRMVAHSWVVTGLSGALLASNISFVAWMFSGLENPLYALVAAVLAAVLVKACATGTLLGRGPAVTCGLLALTAALTRPDGVVLAAAYPLLLLLSARHAPLGRRARAAGLAIGAFALPYAAFLGWRYALFGRLVPNTAVAKAQKLPEARASARTIAEFLTFAGWPAVLMAVGLIGIAVSGRGALRRVLPAVLVPLALTFCAFGALRPDWMGMYRFATPVWVLGTMALSVTTVALAELGTRRARRVVSSMVAVVLFVSVAGQQQAAAEFRAGPTLPMCLIVNRDGVVFNEYADRLGVESPSVLSPSLGGTLLTSDLRVYDLAGLTEPRIADALADNDIERLQAYVFGELRPTFIHAGAVWARKTGMLAPRLTAEGYLPLYPTAEGGGDWVRADALIHPERLRTVQAWAADAVPRAFAEDRNHCGDVLRPGRLTGMVKSGPYTSTSFLTPKSPWF
ncbi:hypothetical protein H1V43_02735 [Streptomyces sp. PSKA54]|uniref:Glycosyltransferase RgtA/B/C/D-like domain-containing protein n=1 Tax=Streptomyces himalayensis subsp. aureolus TaxID=2758039 RepID=A0A7W2CWC4_9ACTN|nr:hypothetical protein [Streptomyces himalayensis]MBA4860316.1 hypothetical protein [Streptomyces himalayensis subsp. aureolus]